MVGKVHPAKKVDTRSKGFDKNFVRMQLELQSDVEKYFDISKYLPQLTFVLREKNKIVSISNVVFCF